MRNKKLPALSTTDAEAAAATESLREVKWLRLALGEMGAHQEEPTPLYEDNEGVIKLSKNNAFHNRSKHIAVRLNYLRAAVGKDGFATFKPIDTADTPADFLTKPVTKKAHEKAKAIAMNTLE